jgi:hypothetical protein
MPRRNHRDTRHHQESQERFSYLRSMAYGRAALCNAMELLPDLSARARESAQLWKLAEDEEGWICFHVKFIL